MKPSLFVRVRLARIMDKSEDLVFSSMDKVTLLTWHHQHALLQDIDFAHALQKLAHDMRSFLESYAVDIGRCWDNPQPRKKNKYFDHKGLINHHAW